VVADVTVTRLGDNHFRVVTGAGFIDSDMGWIRAHVSDDGPVDCVTSLRDLVLPRPVGAESAPCSVGCNPGRCLESGVPYMTARTIDFGGAQVLAQRVTYVGELGWELYVEPAWAVQVWDTLWRLAKNTASVRAVTKRSTL